MITDGTTLLWLTVAAFAFLLVLILVGKMHAFIALIITALGLGLAVGMDPMSVISSVKTGLGDTLGAVVIILALGAMIGRFLEHSGGGRVLAEWFLDRFSERNAVWAIATVSFIIGLPIFFDVAFIIVAPIIWNLTRKSKKSLLYFGLPVSAAMSVTHGLVPPHPAPAVAVAALGADMGLTIVYGILVCIPMAIISGMGYGVWIANRMYIPVPEMANVLAAKDEGDTVKPPHVSTVTFVLILPLALIFAGTVFVMLDLPGKGFMQFIGDPITALTIAALAAAGFLGFARNLNRDQVSKMMGESLAPIAAMLLIMGSSGALKQIMTDSGVGEYAGGLLASTGISPLLVAYLTTVLLRVALGSTTVSVITAAGIVGPLTQAIPGYSPEMVVIAMCCGGTFLSHVNDSGFWIICQYLNLNVPQALRSWSVMKCIDSVVGITVVLIAQALFF